MMVKELGKLDLQKSTVSIPIFSWTADQSCNYFLIRVPQKAMFFLPKIYVSYYNQTSSCILLITSHLFVHKISKESLSFCSASYLLLLLIFLSHGKRRDKALGFSLLRHLLPTQNISVPIHPSLVEVGNA